MGMKNILFLTGLLVSAGAYAVNPFLPLWEFIPDGEPYVFDDPDHPGKQRVYLYGSHDIQRTSYCGRDQVVWSAPVEDLNDWRFDGVIFRSERDARGGVLDRRGPGDVLFAPDVAVKAGPDGKKTYYLYPNNQGAGRKSMIARSDRPDGPFEVCNWDPGEPGRTKGILDFDPGVLVDDDGRVYAYWGFRTSHGAELDPETMASVKPGTQVVTNMVGSCDGPGVFRFFEASSIRKIKGKYVFIYSRITGDGEFGLPETNYTLAYAYSDRPLGPWTYGGTLIDCRGREKAPDGTTRVTACPRGNTHGSLCEIGGNWYVFYHRQSGTNEFSRQAMVAPVKVSVEEVPGGKVTITEGEYTSEGFETGGLDPLARQPAGIACHYVGPAPAKFDYPNVYYPGPWMKTFHDASYGWKNPRDPAIDRAYVTHVVSGSQVGYKYFNFSRTFGRDGLQLALTHEPTSLGGTLEVWLDRPTEAEGGVRLATFALPPNRPGVKTTDLIDLPSLASVKGRHALYFTFAAPVADQSITELHEFAFRTR